MKKINLKIIFTLVILIFSFKGYSQTNREKENPKPLINLKSGSLVNYFKVLRLDSNSIRILTLNLDTTSYYLNEVKNFNEIKNAYLININLENRIREEKALQEKKRIEEENRIKEEKTLQEKKRIEEENRIKEVKRKERKEKEDLISQMHFNNYLYVGGGISVFSINENGIENMVKAANNIELFPIQNASLFKGINLNIEYLVNYSKRKNLSFMLDVSQLKSSIDAPYTKFDFVNNSATLNIGHCFYQKLLKASIGSGISITQNDFITSIEGRPDILCGRINYVTVPLYLQLRYSSISRITFSLKPNLNLHLINSNLIPSYSLNAGLSLCIKKKNKN